MRLLRGTRRVPRPYVVGLPILPSHEAPKDKDLAMIEARMMMPCIRRGIAPRMKCDPNETYWGHKVPGAGTVSGKLVGIEPVDANCSHEEARNKRKTWEISPMGAGSMHYKRSGH